MHINADLYESKSEIEELVEELREMKQYVNGQQALTLDYTINLLEEVAGEMTGDE